MNNQEYYIAKEIAKEYEIALNTVATWIYTKKLPSVKVKTSRLVKKEDLETFRAEMKLRKMWRWK